MISPEGMTTFKVRLRNYGAKEATNLQLSVRLSPNLEIQTLGPHGAAL